MANVHIDPTFDDDERRQRLFAGDVIVFTHVPEVAAFALFARDLVTEVFAPDDPVRVHASRSPSELADILIDFKPRFIHDEDSSSHVRRIVTALGGGDDQTYADVPKLRTAFPAGGLSTGIAYAFQPHRDTWYGAPRQQINWWMPMWPAEADNVMEFYPRWFGAPIENNSSEYNYYEANIWRSQIKTFSGSTDTRVHPAPVHGFGDEEPRLCLIPPVGGIMLFSGDQLHATIPNTTQATRYSIDFRTVDVSDINEGRGAPVADVACTGTALRDFHRLSDGAPLDEEQVAPYDSADVEGPRVYVPS